MTSPHKLGGGTPLQKERAWLKKLFKKVHDVVILTVVKTQSSSVFRFVLSVNTLKFVFSWIP